MIQKKKHGRKIISYMLTLAMIFSMLTGIIPGTSLVVKADGTEISMDGETLKIGSSEWTTTGSGADVNLSLGAGSYILQSDITTTAPIVVSGTVTLDLNGYGITTNKTANTTNKSVIIIGTGATLNLIDSRSTQTSHDYYIDDNGLGHLTDDVNQRQYSFTGGYITGGEGYRYNNMYYGGGVYVYGGTFNMQGGTIIGNQTDWSGGGVNVGKDSSNKSTFNMSGGKIIGNTAKNYGGGVTFDSYSQGTISGGEIAYNTSNKYGGGIIIFPDDIISINGVKIHDNTATECGGGIYLWGPKDNSFEMKGGEVYKNHAVRGGGIYADTLNTTDPMNFWITGGSITENTAEENGGGVYIFKSYLTLKGNPTIKNNKVNGIENNLAGNCKKEYSALWAYSAVVSVNGALTGENESIGIDPSINSVIITSNGGVSNDDITKKFVCDDSSYKFYTSKYTNDQKTYIKFEVKPQSVTLTGGENATVTGSTNQTNLTGAMTTVTYTANEGYYFAAFEDIVNNGVTVRRNNSTNITVSGKPTDDVNIVIPDAIEKTASSVTTEPTADTTLKYDSSEKTLLSNEGVAEGGTINFAVTETNTPPGAGAYSTSVPKKTNAGTYYVWYKVVGDESHNDMAAVTTPIEVTIAKADALSKESLSAAQKPSGEDKTYTGSDIVLLTAPSSLPDGYTGVLYKLSDETEWKNTIPKKNALGTYTVNVKYTGNNYDDLLLDDIEVKIVPVDKTELNTVIQTAQTYLDTIEDKADYESAKTELSDAISSAQAATNNEATTNDVTAAIGSLNLALDKAKYDVYRVDSKKSADALGQTDDSNACKNLINTAKESIDSKTYDESNTLDKNKKAIDEVIEKLQQDLTNQRAADAVANQINGLPSVDDVTISNETAINQARAAYNELTPAQQALVNQDAKDKLQAAENKIADLKLDEAKTTAKNTLATYRNSKDNNLYDQDGITALNTAKSNGDTAIDAATTIEAVDAALQTAKNNIDAVKTRDQKAAANVETEINSLPDPTTITPDNADTHKEIINKAKKDYDDLTDAQENLVSPEAKQKLTYAKKALELALAKKAALSTLNAYRDAKTDSLYDSDDVTALNNAKSDGDTAINNATTVDEVQTALQEATATIDAVKTKNEKAADNVKTIIDELPNPSEITPENAQSKKDAIEAARTAYEALTSEQKGLVDNDTLAKLEAAEAALKLAESKKAAKDALTDDYNTKKDSGAYDQEGLNELKKAYDAAVKAIDEATVSDTKAEPKENGAWKAEQTGETSLATVKTKAQKDQEAADAVKALIDKIPAVEDITEDDLAVVKAAKDAFEALTDDQKAKLDEATKKKLTDAETALAEELADAEEADKVDDIINGLPETGKITPDDEDDIKAAREAYEELTENQKKKVDPEAKKKLEDAEKALELAKAKEEAKDELSDYRDSIDENQYDEDGKKELDKAKTVGEKAIENATTQEELDKALNDAKKALNDVKTKEEKDKEAADAVSKEISKLPESGKVAATDKDAIEKARKAYDALTDDQKKNVPKDALKKLTDAEAAIKATPKETFTTTKASDEKTKDAKISGLDPSKKYQYSSDGGKTWKDVTGVKELDVMPGTYLLRYAGDNNSAPGAYVEVTVEAEDKQEKTVDMYRLYNPNSGEHFYTASAGEKDFLVSVGWSYEGVGWKAPEKSNTPVYRVYNPNAGDHHYTTNKAEKDFLVSVGWNDEGIGWYSDDTQSLPIYRQYNPNAVSGAHNFTSSKGENDWLVSLGWSEEGIGWYGVK